MNSVLESLINEFIQIVVECAELVVKRYERRGNKPKPKKISEQERKERKKVIQTQKKQNQLNKAENNNLLQR